MPERSRLNEQLVIDAAVDMVNARGAQSLSLAELAARFRVRPPSLYNHVNGLDGVRRALSLRSLRELAGVLQMAAAGRSGSEALRAVAVAYREFAHKQPGLYAFTQRPDTGDDHELQAASRAVVDVVLAVLRGYHLADDAALHATRALRSALHGFVLLETAGGFGLPLDVDASFDWLVAALDRGLHAGS